VQLFRPSTHALTHGPAPSSRTIRATPSSIGLAVGLSEPRGLLLPTYPHLPVLLDCIHFAMAFPAYFIAGSYDASRCVWVSVDKSGGEGLAEDARRSLHTSEPSGSPAITDAPSEATAGRSGSWAEVGSGLSGRQIGAGSPAGRSSTLRNADSGPSPVRWSPSARWPGPSAPSHRSTPGYVRCAHSA